MKNFIPFFTLTSALFACPFCGGGTSLEAANTYLAITLFLSALPIFLVSVALFAYKYYKRKLQGIEKIDEYTSD